MEKSRKPKIRFKGYNDDWEQRELNELALFNPKDELPQTFEYVDLEAVVGTEMLSHRTETRSSAPSRAQRLARAGDLFYQTVRPYQKNNYLFKKHDNNYVFSTGYAQMRPYVDGYFLLSLVQSDCFVKVVLDNCTGTSYPAINANDLAEIEVVSPLDENETQKIGAIFHSIDSLITLHQRKLDKLINVKKSMLEKMFPKQGSTVPEVRFSGFTEDWEQRKVTELGMIYIGLVTTMTSHYTNDGILLIRNSDIKDGRFEFGDNQIFLERSFAKANESRMHQLGDVITVHTGDVGTSAVITKNEVKSIGFATIVTRPNRAIINPYYLCTFLNTEKHKKWAVAISTGDGRTNYNLGDYLELIIPVPSINEQKEIALFIEKINTLITLHQRKLEKLKNIKKSMLEKMFI
ncbi:restriction endonuclease subunit S [Catenibacterium sp.]|uniref:restriction endonuclease subunit S n=1 Tax=Catenibacterium sp. TaxID=2049022 RepID=UPI002E77DCC7|nr:restriction endonuclease subunit S [Catenibacterium sp.]MEE0041115.1 restriction endonuclease subunit S [Catenibacterium sp.]